MSKASRMDDALYGWDAEAAEANERFRREQRALLPWWRRLLFWR